jgi:putative nucleotidyltransferase with HDIG domain
VDAARGVLEKMQSKVLPVRGGQIGAALATGQPSVDDGCLQDNFLNMFVNMTPVLFSACIPLTVGDEKVGVLWVGRTRSARLPQRYSPQEVALLKAVGEMSAHAIHRTRQYDHTVRYAEQMKAITLAGDALVQVLEISEIYENLDQSLANLFPDICGVYISSFDPAVSLFKYEFGRLDGARIDIFRLPMLKLDPPGRDAQSDAVHTRQPVIVNNLEASDLTGSASILVGPAGQPVHSILCAPMIEQGGILGVIQVLSHSANRFTPGDSELLMMVGNIAAVAIQNARMIDRLEHRNIELTQSFDITLEGWSNAVELRDPETQGHLKRVSQLATQLAAQMGIHVDQLEQIRRGALLHDIGKIGVPDHILNKSAALTAQEWEIMRRHPQYAYDILRSIPFLLPAIDIPYCHHERWDGTGYPRGLKGDQIPISARIFTVIDVWDALRSNRPYRKAWTASEAAAYMQNQSNKLFDPLVLKEFFKLMKLEDLLEVSGNKSYR